MRAFVKRAAGPGGEFVTQADVPRPGDLEVLVQVAASSLCGTDLDLYEWPSGAESWAPTFPLIMGHEASGTVVKVGAAVRNVRVGDRVALESHLFCGNCAMCRSGNAHNCLDMRILGITWDGSFAEYVRAPASACFAVPASVPLETAALFEPAGVAVHAVQKAGNIAGRTVAVTGCGPIGLLVIQVALALGAASVVASEPNPYRRQLAENAGARVVDPTDGELTGLTAGLPGGGVELGFETSGAVSALPALLGSAAREARIVTVGHPGAAVPLDVSRWINKHGITLTGVFGRRIWDSWELLVRLVESGRLDLEGLITHRLGLDELPRGLELLRGDAGKVLVHPGS